MLPRRCPLVAWWLFSLLAAGSLARGNEELGEDEELQVPKLLGTWFGVAVATNNSELLALMRALNGSAYEVRRGAERTVVIHGVSLVMNQCMRETKHFRLMPQEKILIPFVPENESKRTFTDFLGDTNATYRFLWLQHSRHAIMEQRGVRNGSAEAILYLLARSKTPAPVIVSEFRKVAARLGLDGKAAVMVSNTDKTSELCPIHEDTKPGQEQTLPSPVPPVEGKGERHRPRLVDEDDSL